MSTLCSNECSPGLYPHGSCVFSSLVIFCFNCFRISALCSVAWEWGPPQFCLGDCQRWQLPVFTHVASLVSLGIVSVPERGLCRRCNSLPTLLLFFCSSSQKLHDLSLNACVYLLTTGVPAWDISKRHGQRQSLLSEGRSPSSQHGIRLAVDAQSLLGLTPPGWELAERGAWPRLGSCAFWLPTPLLALVYTWLLPEKGEKEDCYFTFKARYRSLKLRL